MAQGKGAEEDSEGVPKGRAEEAPKDRAKEPPKDRPEQGADDDIADNRS